MYALMGVAIIAANAAVSDEFILEINNTITS
jgi:hypothetical protein